MCQISKFSLETVLPFSFRNGGRGLRADGAGVPNHRQSQGPPRPAPPSPAGHPQQRHSGFGGFCLVSDNAVVQTFFFVLKKRLYSAVVQTFFLW